MKKPEEPIRSKPLLDCGIAQQVARRLERSRLHVYGAYVCMSAPPGLDDFPDGGPYAGAEVSMFHELALVTDGDRGWLVLTPPGDGWDAEPEITEFIADCLGGVEDPPRCVVRAATCHAGPVVGLDLRDAHACWAVLEAEYEGQLHGSEGANLDALLAVFRASGYAVQDEARLRAEMNEWAECA